MVTRSGHGDVLRCAGGGTPVRRYCRLTLGARMPGEGSSPSRSGDPMKASNKRRGAVIGRLLRLVIAVVVVVAAYVAFNTWRHGSRQLEIGRASCRGRV